MFSLYWTCWLQLLTAPSVQLNFLLPANVFKTHMDTHNIRKAQYAAFKDELCYLLFRTYFIVFVLLMYITAANI